MYGVTIIHDSHEALMVNCNMVHDKIQPATPEILGTLVCSYRSCQGGCKAAILIRGVTFVLWRGRFGRALTRCDRWARFFVGIWSYDSFVVNSAAKRVGEKIAFTIDIYTASVDVFLHVHLWTEL